MNTIKAFFKDRGLYLACLALVFGATAGGILGIRSALRGLVAGPQAGITQEDTTWNQPDAPANDPVADVPVEPLQPSAPPSAVPQPSGASSPASAGQSAPAPSAAPSSRPPVSPVDGGERGTPFSGDTLVYHAALGDWRTHNGADYTGAPGADVYAMAGGEVSAVYTDALWGTVVEVSAANGRQWRYCGLAQAAVQRGETVATGKKLGTLADTLPAEADAGAHLHMECMADGGYLDPAV